MASESLGEFLKIMFTGSFMLSICLCYGYVLTITEKVNSIRSVE